MYTYMHCTYQHTHIPAYTHQHTHTSTHTYQHTHTSAKTHVHIRAHTHDSKLICVLTTERSMPEQFHRTLQELIHTISDQRVHKSYIFALGAGGGVWHTHTPLAVSSSAVSCRSPPVASSSHELTSSCCCKDSEGSNISEGRLWSLFRDMDMDPRERLGTEDTGAGSSRFTWGRGEGEEEGGGRDLSPGHTYMYMHSVYGCMKRWRAMWCDVTQGEVGIFWHIVEARDNVVCTQCKLED